MSNLSGQRSPRDTAMQADCGTVPELTTERIGHESNASKIVYIYTPKLSFVYICWVGRLDRGVQTGHRDVFLGVIIREGVYCLVCSQVGKFYVSNNKGESLKREE